MSRTKPTKKAPVTREEVQEASLAWAEFLYDGYMLSKHKQLHLDNPDFKMESDKGVTSE